MYNFLFTHQDQIVHVSRLIVGCLAVALPMILLYGFATITTKEILLYGFATITTKENQ
jgi:hypothetical protein